MKPSLSSLVISACILFMATALPAQTDPGFSFHLSCNFDSSQRVEPGSILNLGCQVFNPSEVAQDFDPEVVPPADWRIITAIPPTHLDPGDQQLWLVSIHIPQATKAGVYSISIGARTGKQTKAPKPHIVQIEIPPTPEASITFAGTQRTVVAGDVFKLLFIISNKGNTDIKGRLRCQRSPAFVATSDVEEFYLAPGNKSSVWVSVETEAEAIPHNRVILEAVFDTPELSPASASALFEILPRATKQRLPWRHFPIEASFRLFRTDEGENSQGLEAQLEIRGSAHLDENRSWLLDFGLRGPDTNTRSFLDLREQYRAELSSENLSLYLGDGSYPSSRTIGTSYARGISLSTRHGRFRTYSYGFKTLWQDPAEQRIGATVGYQFQQNLDIDLSLIALERESIQRKVAALRGRYSPIDNISLEFEYALADNDQPQDAKSNRAIWSSITGNHSWISFAAEYRQTGENFPSYYNNGDFFSGNLALSVNAKLNLTASAFLLQRSFLPEPPTVVPPEHWDDVLRFDILEDRTYQVGFSYLLGKTSSFAIDYRQPSRKGFTNKAFATSEKNWLARIRLKPGRWNIDSSAEHGVNTDLLTGLESTVKRISFGAGYGFTERSTLSTHLNYSSNDPLSGVQRSFLGIGVNTHLAINATTSIDVRLRTDEILAGGYGRGTSIDAGISHTFPNLHQLTFYGRLNTLSTDESHQETSIVMNYSVPIAIPIARKKNLGAVTGIVFDSLNDEPMAGVILRIAGTVAVTSHKGHFGFSSLVPGSYYLDVLPQRVCPNCLPQQQFPIKIEVRDGEDTKLSIPLTRFASLGGRITLGSRKSTAKDKTNPDHIFVSGIDRQSSVGAPQESLPQPDSGIKDILLILSNGAEVRRMVSEHDGSFVFHDLRPGPWTLKVYSHNLPSNYVLDQNVFEIDLTPRSHEEIHIAAQPRLREIRIIHDGGKIKRKP